MPRLYGSGEPVVDGRRRAIERKGGERPPPVLQKNRSTVSQFCDRTLHLNRGRGKLKTLIVG